MTCNSGDGTFYVNGVNVSQVTCQNILNGARLELGGAGQSWGSNRYDGKLDEPRIYKRKLTSQEMLSIYKSNMKHVTTNEYEFLLNRTGLSEGVYIYNATACDTLGNCDSTIDRFYEIKFPSLTIDLITPLLNHVNWSQNSTNEVTAQVCCIGADCGNVTTTLDPTQDLTFVFTKTSFGSEADCITDNVCLTRGDQWPLFNNVSQVAGDVASDCSANPDNTSWATGPCDSHGTFQNLFDLISCSPDSNMVGVQYCLNLTADEELLDIEFNVWDNGNDDPGGGFSYNRSEIGGAGAGGKGGTVSNTPGIIPFWTEELNPNSTVTLNQDECINYTWYVNATGPENQSINYTFFVYTNWTQDLSVNNISTMWNVTISDPLEVVAIDNCACPGFDTNWEINLSKYCITWGDCDLGTGNLTFVDDGNFTINGTITTSNVGDLGAGNNGYTTGNGTVYVSS